MPLPASWKTVTVTATFTRADTAGPAAGSVQFTPVKAVGIAADVVLPALITATLNGSGQISVALPCPNGAGVTSLVYEVIERVPGGRSYYIEVLASMTGSIALADLDTLTDDQAVYYSLRGPTGPEGDVTPEALAAQAAAEAAASAASASATAADGSADAAAASASAAAASIATGAIYPDTATGLAATTSGQYFSVPSADSAEYLILYKNNAGSALEVKRYPSADAVTKPKWTGIRSGWPDPFFRHIAYGDSFLGRMRWESSSTGTSLELVDNPDFDGSALYKNASGDTDLSGPVIYLDELGAETGDTIAVRALIVGDGGNGFFAGRFRTAVGGWSVGSQINGTPFPVTTTSATPQLVTIEATVPATATVFRLFPYTTTSGKTLKVIALWAYKGTASAGPPWPTIAGSRDTLLLENHEDRIAANEAAVLPVAYGFDSSTIVESSAESITLNGTSFSTLARDLPFMGWGEPYTPAGVSFNAIKVKSISRTPGTTSEWRTLNVVVRTGATPAAGGATLVAVGSVTVVPSEDALTDVTILLRDPTTNEAVTLTDADFTTQYFIGVYALNADGEPAACGEPRGTMTNTVGQSYYHPSGTNDPEAGAWTSYTSNKRIGLQHLLLTAPQELTVFEPSAQFVNDIETKLTIPAPEIVLPPYLFGVAGREMNVYFDNLHLADASEYLHDVTTSSAVGAHQNERWTYTPAGALAAGTFVYSAHDKRTGTSLVSKTAQLRAAASTAGTGTTKKVMVIGDSLVGAGTITQTLLDNADGMGVTLLGTLGTGLNKHEGRGGWSITTYTTNYAGNPFWIGGQVDFPGYLAANTVDTPDWVLIHLGINDCFGQTSDTACSDLADTLFTSLDTLIASIKAAGAGVKVGLMIPSPPSFDQDSFGANYTTAQNRWRFKRNIMIWARQLIAKYAGQEASRIYIVPSNVNLDTVNNMSRAAAAPINSRTALTSTRQNNSVHPATEGYRQIGDAVWAFLKFYA